jgi:adenylate kinase
MAPRFGIAHIATGDIFRELAGREDELGLKVRNYMDRGQLVPDEIVIDIVKERLARPDCVRGFILDGYPRTLPQAEALSNLAEVDVVINLDVPDEVIVERLSGRRTCSECDTIYHTKFLKPRRPGVCDRCGGRLYQRVDDTPSVIRKRLKVYAQQTEPLISYYEKKGLLRSVSCDQADIPPEKVIAQICTVLRELGIIK